MAEEEGQAPAPEEGGEEEQPNFVASENFDGAREGYKFEVSQTTAVSE